MHLKESCICGSILFWTVGSPFITLHSPNSQPTLLNYSYSLSLSLSVSLCKAWFCRFNTMIQNNDHNPNPDPEPVPEAKNRRHVRRHRCLIAIGFVIFLIMLLFIVLLILVLTVFKAKQPKTQLVSATLDGISPRISFPVVRIQLNITLNLQILVENPNHASFKHGSGQSILLYQGEQVGDVEIYPGNIPGRRSTTIPSRLTLQVDKVASETLHLVQDILAGQLAMDTRTRIPGRVTFLGLIRKHVVAISDCHFVIAVPEMKVRSQECKERTKFWEGGGFGFFASAIRFGYCL